MFQFEFAKPALGNASTTL